MTDGHVPNAAGNRPRQSFVALHDAGFRSYFIYSALAMMADSIEHVISYWMIFQKFHSPALAGFAVFSHWMPTLVFGVFAGALADRFDSRRLIQIGMVSVHVVLGDVGHPVHHRLARGMARGRRS